MTKSRRPAVEEGHACPRCDSVTAGTDGPLLGSGTAGPTGLTVSALRLEKAGEGAL